MVLHWYQYNSGALLLGCDIPKVRPDPTPPPNLAVAHPIVEVWGRGGPWPFIGKHLTNGALLTGAPLLRKIPLAHHSIHAPLLCTGGDGPPWIAFSVLKKIKEIDRNFKK
jgi:hypothetical protein